MSKKANKYEAQLKYLDVIEKQRQLGIGIYEDDTTHTYTFTREVNENSVRHCLDTILRWHDEAPECDITLVLNSPGGDTTYGMWLFDELRNLSLRGGGKHHLTTVVRGEACSMASVLAQVGDWRVMGPSALFMIHEASWIAVGKASKMADNTRCVELIGDVMTNIFVERSKLSRKEFRKRFLRKDWWLTAKECKRLGFIDEVK